MAGRRRHRPAGSVPRSRRPAEHPPDPASPRQEEGDRPPDGPERPVQPLDRMPVSRPGESHLHQLSRAIQALLRHRATATGVATNSGGWADYDDVLALPWVRQVGANPDTLDALVSNRWSPKAPGRFQSREVDGRWQIRATQGHTMGHVRLEEVAVRILPSDPAQSRVLYHFVAFSVWQSGALERGLAPCGSRRQRVVFLSPQPDPAGPGWRAFRDTVVIAVDAAQVHRLGLPLFLSCEGDSMIEGIVPQSAWSWAVRHQPDGNRVRLWHRPASTPAEPVAICDASGESGSPCRRERVVGARRAADCGSFPPPARPPSAPRAPPPPRDGGAGRASAIPHRQARRAEARGRRPSAASRRGRSRSPLGSSYSASESPSARAPVSVPTDPGRSMGSRGSGSDRLSGRGVYARDRSHGHLPAPDRRPVHSPPQRRTQPRSPAPRSRSRHSRRREVVLTATRDAPAWAVDPVQIWMPSGTSRPASPATVPGRPRGGNRPKPSGPPHRGHPPRRTHQERRRRRRADGE